MDKIQTYLDTAPGNVLSIILIVAFAFVTQEALKIILKRSSGLLTRRDLFKSTHDREKRINTINGIITAIVGVGVWSVAFIMILNALGVATGPILASLGILTAAIAFGTQSLIKDFVSGLFIIAENQYKIDDYVNIGVVSGRVEAISIRTTTIRGDDGSINFVPNGSITFTSNKSVPQLKELIILNISSDTNLASFAKELTTISKSLQVNEHTADLVKDGPSISAIQNITKDSITVTLEIKITAPKSADAVSAVWREIHAASEKGTIKLG